MQLFFHAHPHWRARTHTHKSTHTIPAHGSVCAKEHLLINIYQHVSRKSCNTLQQRVAASLRLHFVLAREETSLHTYINTHTHTHTNTNTHTNIHTKTHSNHGVGRALQRKKKVSSPTSGQKTSSGIKIFSSYQATWRGGRGLQGKKK